MTASTQATNLKHKRLHFMPIHSSTQYFRISFLIVTLTRLWHYLFQSERGQSHAGINYKNCHLFITIVLLVYSKRVLDFKMKGFVQEIAQTCKTSPRKNILGMQVGIIHNMPNEHFSACPGLSLVGMDTAPPPSPLLRQREQYCCNTSPSVTKLSASFKRLYSHLSYKLQPDHCRK